jgi:hypothetical protein
MPYDISNGRIAASRKLSTIAASGYLVPEGSRHRELSEMPGHAAAQGYMSRLPPLQVHLRALNAPASSMRARHI